MSKSIQSNPRDPSLLEQRARLYTHLGRYDEAAREFAAALAKGDYEIQRRSVDSAMRHDQVFSRVANLLPHDTWLRNVRGQFFAYRGHWQRAVREYEPFIEPYRVGGATEEYARLLLLTGNDEEYRRLCRRLSAHFGEPDTAGAAYLLVSICTAGPRSGVEPERIVQWDEQAVAASRIDLYLFALGAANYRAGRYERAVECMEESDARWGTQRTANVFFLAMAFHRLGQHEKSRKCYDIGLEVLRSAAPPPDTDDPATINLGGWLHLNVTHREAKAVLGLTEKEVPQTEKRVP